MRNLNHIFILFIFLSLIGSNYILAQDVIKPDFAYPKQVLQQSEANLKKAIKNEDGNLVIKSLIEYAVALDKINSDSIQSTINIIEQVVAKEKDPCTKALLNSLLLDIYCNIYNSNRSIFGARENIGIDIPSNFNKWSKADFTNKIKGLIAAILSDEEALKNAPLKDFGNIITHNDLTYIFYPTLYDFTIFHIISSIDNTFVEPNPQTPRIDNIDRFISSNSENDNEFIALANSLYRDILSFHIQDIAPLINWEINRLEFEQDINIFSNKIKPNELEKQYIEALNYLFKKYESSEYATNALLVIYGEILYKIYDPGNIYTAKELYDIFTNRLKKFPAYYNNCSVNKCIDQLTQQEIVVSYPTLIVPNDTLTIYVENTNSKFYTVEIHRLPDDIIPQYQSGDRFNTNKTFETQLVSKFTPTTFQKVPFHKNDTIKTSLTYPGYYTIIVYSDSIKKEFENQLIRCTNSQVTNGSLNNSNDNRMWVLNPKTGAPIVGTDISIYDTNTKKVVNTTTSRKDGKFDFTLKSRQYVKAHNEIDIYSNPETLYIYSHNNQNNYDELAKATIFTSLPIYHPGDSIEWSAVIYNQNDDEAQLCKNRTFTIMLRDANYMEIDTLVATTDWFGRIQGKFLIPIDRLTGNYSINIIGKYNRVIGRGSFMVSDYKLPTFNVTISTIENNQDGTYSICGKVKTLSNFPIEGASTTISFSGNYNLSSINFTDSITTDSEGKFSFTVPITFFDKHFPSAHFFKAKITATSITGESQSASRYFSTGKQFSIINSNSSQIEASKNIKINAKIININRDYVNGNIYYMLIDKEKQFAKQDSFSTTSPVVDWSKVPSGEYELKLYSIAPTATDTISSTIYLYRLTDSNSPSKSELWIQNYEYTITKGHSTDIYYGSPFESAEILYILYDNDTIYEQRWIKAKKGIHKTRVFMPQNVNNAKLTLYTINNYNSYSRTISIKRDNTNKSIKISAESFRDKIIPGNEEQWHFSVTDNSGNGSESAMIFNMYSLAIDKIKKHNFNLGFPSFDHIINYSFTPYLYNAKHYFNIKSQLKSYSCPYITQPELYTYDHQLGRQNNRNTIVRHGRGETMLAAKSSFDAIIEEESEPMDEVVVPAMGQTSEKKKLSYAIQSISPETIEPNISLRDNETPLAFFRPMLTTDTLGNLTFSFTVPNANTTWRFNAIAYNDNMELASFTRDVLANKPIMVQPNMPRFLRNGDKATVKASVMNNSDSTLIVSTFIELFDPTTAKTISRYLQSDTIIASQSAIASIEITAPTDATMIGYRIKSYCDNFGDGEQSLIPILPATSPLIESTTFYMGTNERSYTQQLPTITSEAKVTLEFCENPTWYAVTALPGLNKDQSRTSISAAMAIYSAAIADGIVRQNPQIANALYQWQHSDKTDSTLVSMLSRNQDLKNMLLSATPWVQNAENDTERMARLALLFNKKEIKTSIEKSLHLLATLQRSGGGWAWIAENNEASLWATLSILEKLGHLKKLGFLPDDNDIHTMIKNAITYLDTYFAQQYKKYPKNDYSNYVLIRDFFPEYKQSTAALKVTNSTIQQIISSWRNYSLVKKASSAIILNNHDYNSTAREILKSISEFSQTTPSRGMWWPSIENSNTWEFDKIREHTNILDAYAQITPSNNDIDKMRQWLIINKEANDWGNSSATSYVIYTLLSTGSRWTNNALGSEITLNNETINTTHFDNITGYLRSDISKLSPSNKRLTIAKHSNQPAWGAVYCQYDATMSDIKALSGNDISIEKVFLKQIGDSWLPSDTFAIGDNVKIQLTVKTSRNFKYITISDERAACFEPTEQLPCPIYSEGICFYRENRDDATNIFITNLPKGTYLLSYDMYVNNQGEFLSGIATIQSQYAPQITAHSAGNMLYISSK